MPVRAKVVLQTLILIILPICSSLCIDMYLPAYHDIASSFNVQTGMMNLTMSIYLIGLAGGQLFYGPISDRFGRKTTLMPGLLLFCLASFLCAYTSNFYLFLLGRLLQALGAGSAIVLSRAIVADSYEPKKRTQILALISAANIFSPGLAPLYGGFVATYFNWRMIFSMLAFFSVFMLFCTQFFIKETLVSPNKNSLKLSALNNNLKRILQDSLFTRYAFILGMFYILIFAWVTLSPNVLIQYFHVKPTEFGLYFVLPAFASCIGALFTAKFSSYFDNTKFIKYGLLLIFFAALGLLITKDFIVQPLYLVTFIAIIFFGTGMTNPQLISVAIGKFLDIGGFASSMIGFIQTFFGALLGILTSYYYSSGMHAIGLLLIFPAVLSLIIFLPLVSKMKNLEGVV